MLRLHARWFAPVALVELVAFVALTPAPAVGQQGRYSAEIRWTSYGIPHVKAKSYGDLGYGFAYATATDAFCTMARDVATVNGELSAHFGSADGNIESDVFHRAVLDSAAIARYPRGQDAKARAFSAGYVAGYNRYLRDHTATLPAACAGAPWVRPITDDDVSRLAVGNAIRYGLGNYQRPMAAATPPKPAAAPAGTPAPPSNDFAALADFDARAAFGIGSNAVAMGRAVTASGRGLLLGNPHYPWSGASRFHLIHLTVPGDVDVMGVSLYTTPRVGIGFNKDIAWTHTVSTGTRSTLYALDLDPANPTRYRYGAGWRDMQSRRVSITVRQADGTITTESRVTWFTHVGPVIAAAPIPWTTTRAFAVRDANLENDRGAMTYDALARARSVDDVEKAISLQGTSWVNTVATDRAGTAYYADMSTVPNLDSAFLARCRWRMPGAPPTPIILTAADSTCAWPVDPRSSIAGAMPPALMPRLRRDDVVSNANDSYWLTNPAAPLEGYAPTIGAERTARSLRTRAGLAFIEEALAKGGKMEPAMLQQLLLAHRNYGAELLVPDLLTLCAAPVTPVVNAQGSVDITPACDALAKWDRRETVESRGAQVWREFWRVAARIPNVYAVPFDVADPAHTPRGLAVGQAPVRDALRGALATAQTRLAQQGVALDAALGTVQFTEVKGVRYPVPGGEGPSGAWSVISSQLKPGGYAPIIAGNSYIQVVGWSRGGVLDARGLITYSQSDNPDSPHATDLTRLYAKGELPKLPFTEAEIRADKQLKVLRIRE